MKNEKLEAEIMANIRAKKAALMVCERAKTGQCKSGNCHWHSPHSAGELPKHMECRAMPVNFVPVGHPRHCVKCDRSEDACRCASPELMEDK